MCVNGREATRGAEKCERGKEAEAHAKCAKTTVRFSFNFDFPAVLLFLSFPSSKKSFLFVC